MFECMLWALDFFLCGWRYPMKITRFNHAAVNIHGKVDEAREFYIELLGLPEVPIQLPGRPPIPKGAIQAFWMELGGCQVHVIGAPAKGELREPTGPHVSWYVADLDQAVGELDRARHRDARARRGARAIVWVADPAGNTVEFQQDPNC